MEITSDMIEAGARALHAVERRCLALWNTILEPWEQMTEVARESYRTQARLCLQAAMSEVSDIAYTSAERLLRLEAVANAVDKWERLRAELNNYTADVKAGRRTKEQRLDDLRRLVSVLDEVSLAMDALRALER